MSILLHSIAYPVTALGPGVRVAIWAAGCRLSCKGCITPELQDKSSGRPVPTTALANHILSLPLALNGLTLTGGEPFDQAREFGILVSQVREHIPDWDVIAFSGYPLRTLRKDSECRALLELVDVLIHGPYVDGNRSNSSMVASENQRIHSFSDRGESLRRKMEHAPVNQANLGIARDNSSMLIGILDPEDRRRRHDLIASTKGVAYADLC